MIAFALPRIEAQISNSRMSLSRGVVSFELRYEAGVGLVGPDAARLVTPPASAHRVSRMNIREAAEKKRMTLMVEVSAGELIDKITILEIKLANIADAAKRTNVRHEYERLSATATAALPQSAALAELTEALKEVNAALWRIEDEIRDKERALSFDAEFIALARSVYRTNDRRAALKREINLLLSSEIVEEKSYAAY